DVRYTVTNLGSGPTGADSWTDTVWLTQNKNRRPNPDQGDYLLASFPHTGALPLNAGYDQQVQVTLPHNLDSGTWYIVPWVDPFGTVLQNSLASNVNPDDPSDLLSENFKARPISVISAQPDLQVTSVTAPASAAAGGSYTVSWTVTNKGNAPANPDG